MSEIEGYQPHSKASDFQRSNRNTLYELFRNRPMPDDQLLVNLGLYMRSSALATVLYHDELYRRILKIPGVIMEFGIWWGQNVVILGNLRAVHEPYNYSRRVIGFDTFKGYGEISEKDVKSETIKPGGYTVSEEYKKYLERLVEYHENENVMAHINKHALIEGDATVTLRKYLEDNPETIIALAYFDMALYEPTKACLQAIEPHLIKGSVVALDEINSPEYPGETIALKEAWGLKKYRILKSRYLPDRAYVVID